MDGDSESRTPPPADRDLWTLPEITSVTIERVRYRRPRRHTVAGGVTEHDEGVEIVVRTKGEIPIRALSPALHVGTSQIAENEQLDPTTYRFFVLDDSLRDGDPIVLGWVGHVPPPGRTRFRYETPSTTITR